MAVAGEGYHNVLLICAGALALGLAIEALGHLVHARDMGRAEELLRPLLQEQRNGTGVLSDVISNQNPKSSVSPVQSQSEGRPLAICILLDTSGSMYEKGAEVIAAALTVVKATTPHGEFCILSFDDEVFNTLPHDEDFTSNIKEMEEALKAQHIELQKLLDRLKQLGES